MENPYLNLPDKSFWRRSVASLSNDDVDPVSTPSFKISKAEKVVTVGSCFAQHISRMLMREGFTYYVTEAQEGQSEMAPFSAAYGNVYTVRQLLQMFNRAYGIFAPKESVWKREDGRLVDAFRPKFHEAGFSTLDELEAEREKHLAAIRLAFEECDILIFTLGLTECWISGADGAAYPIAPGVAGSGAEFSGYRFINLTVPQMIADLEQFLDKLKTVNSGCRVILTVSPVPLIASYENRHVLLSNTYSKAALRVVAEEISKSRENVSYFPSYEIITGPHQRSRFYAEDLREVTPEGVAQVMKLFKKYYLSGDVVSRVDGIKNPTKISVSASDNNRMSELNRVICEEELLDQNRD